MKNQRKKKEWYTNKTTMAVYVVLRLLVILTMVRCIFRREFESVFLCAFSLVLMILPSILQKTLKITLPSTMEVIILLFIFCAEILGEINSFYIKVENWDTILHTLNGFCCAAIGFSLVDMLNRSERFSVKLSPLFLAIVAFCFSMTVGVLWEFFEFGSDLLVHTDMQKDTIVNTVYTVELDETRSNKVIAVDDIQDVIVVHSDGSQQSLGLGGYLDIGIADTMKDLFVNFIGAVVFSIIGYIYVASRGKGKFASRFIPQVEMEQNA